MNKFRKKLLTICLCSAIATGLVTTGAFALYFNAQKADVVATNGDVSVVLDKHGDASNTLNLQPAGTQTNQYITQTYVAESKSTIPVYIRMRINCSKKDLKTTSGLDSPFYSGQHTIAAFDLSQFGMTIQQTTKTSWVQGQDGFWYYKYPVSANSKTADFTVQIPRTVIYTAKDMNINNINAITTSNKKTTNYSGIDMNITVESCQSGHHMAQKTWNINKIPGIDFT
jgi:hypothetical protein